MKIFFILWTGSEFIYSYVNKQWWWRRMSMFLYKYRKFKIQNLMKSYEFMKMLRHVMPQYPYVDSVYVWLIFLYSFWSFLRTGKDESRSPSRGGPARSAHSITAPTNRKTSAVSCHYRALLSLSWNLTSFYHICIYYVAKKRLLQMNIMTIDLIG